MPNFLNDKEILVRRTLYSLLLLACLAFSASPAFALEPSIIALASGDLDLGQDPPRNIDPALRAAELAPGQTGYWIIHWDRPVNAAMKDAARAAGAELFGYLPRQAFLAAMTFDEAAVLRAQPGVDWVGRHHPAYALDPSIGQRQWQDPARAADPRLQLTVELFPGTDANLLAAGASRLGAELYYVRQDPAAPRLSLALAAERLHELVRLPGVQWIEDLPELTDRNHNVVWITQTASSGVTSIWDQGLHGEGQVLGHIDGGVRESSCYFDDPDGDPVGPNHRKIVYQSGGYSAHGTHTAGTAVGNQTPVNGADGYNGLAYEAKMATSTYGGGNFDLYGRLVLHHGYDARVHTNSWGDDGTTAYTSWCRDIDRYSHDYEDGLVAFAVTNLSSLKSPENAKNVLAVGATSNPNYENHGSGGQGPTADGRRKPEIYAPGCYNRSATTGTCGTTTMCGTSMACPAISAAGLLAHQFYLEGFYPSGSANASDALTPSGALLRATLINGTFDMSGVTGYPSNREGWGRLVLEEALAFGGESRGMWVVDVRNANGLQAGGLTEYSLQISSADEALKVTLAFTGPPATVGAGNPVINNLDLELVAPDGARYKGNWFVSGQSATGGSFDTKNNVERVVLDNPLTGEWTLRVIATDVPQGPQGYAIAVGGAVSQDLTAVGESPATLALRLDPARPNPFNPKTNLRFNLPVAGEATLAIYDMTGRLQKTLHSGRLDAGDHELEWQGRDDRGAELPSGVYFARLEALGVSRSQKLNLLK